MGVFPGPRWTTRTVSKWTRHEVACTEETLLAMLEEAYQSCVFGNDYPPLILYGNGFSQALRARLLTLEEPGPYSCLNALRAVDDRGGYSWMARIFMWDRESYTLPILFVGATVKLVDAV